MNELELDFEGETFDGKRYSYDIDVEEVASVPRYTENARKIVLSGINDVRNRAVREGPEAASERGRR